MWSLTRQACSSKECLGEDLVPTHLLRPVKGPRRLSKFRDYPRPYLSSKTEQDGGRRRQLYCSQCWLHRWAGQAAPISAWQTVTVPAKAGEGDAHNFHKCGTQRGVAPASCCPHCHHTRLSCRPHGCRRHFTHLSHGASHETFWYVCASFLLWALSIYHKQSCSPC